MSVIYEPKGRALEFADLALSIWQGCMHRCDYCFNSTRPRSAYKSPEAMAEAVRPREGVLQALAKEAVKLAGDQRHILLQFTGDPYPRQEADACVTRKGLSILRENNLSWDVLTKAGTLACRDFDLYEGTASRFAQTVVLYHDALRQRHEPGAAPIRERYAAFVAARARGIQTWCSLEPFWLVEEALSILSVFRKVVDFWKIGKINEDPREKTIDWMEACERIATAVRANDLRYVVKKCLHGYWPNGVPLDTREAPPVIADILMKERKLRCTGS